MKKNSFLTSTRWALIFTMFVGAFVSSCNKKSDPTPAPAATAKIFTSVVTPQTVTSGSANVVGTVTTSDGSAYLKLEVTSGGDNLDHVYITTSQDNGPMAAYVPVSNYTDSTGTTYTAGGDGASYKMANTKNFVLLVPVTVRTTSAAVSDAYSIWFTNGKGDFSLSAKNRKLGPITITLNYVANAGPSFSTVTGVTLGDQYATPGSLLVTSGQISALTTASYDTSAASADLSLSELNSSGDLRTGSSPYTGGAKGSGSLWLISPSLRLNAGYVNEPGSANSTFTSTSSPNMTYISVATGVDFDAATGATLAGLSVGTTQKVQIVQGGVYQFQTAGGKQGLIKVTTLTATTASAGGTAVVSVKVLN